jgi:hypothetical protein
MRLTFGRVLDRSGLTRVIITGAWLGSQFSNRVSTHDGGRHLLTNVRAVSIVMPFSTRWGYVVSYPEKGEIRYRSGGISCQPHCKA